MSEREPVLLDGTYGEGGGSIPRLGLGFAALTGRLVEVSQVRVGRKKPGLRTQHLAGATAIASLCGGTIEGASLGSTRVVLRPGDQFKPRVRVQIQTAGSVGLFLQGTTLAASKPRAGPRTFHIDGGGTYGAWAPSTAYLTNVTFPVLKRMGLVVELDVKRHGFYPRGGASAVARIRPPAGPLKPLVTTDLGKIKRIVGEVVVSRGLANRKVVERISKHIRQELASLGHCDVELKGSYVDALNAGVGVDLWAETSTGARPSSGTVLGRRDLPSNRVASDAAKRLARCLELGAPFDEYLLDQVIPYLCLAKGRSMVGSTKFSSHSKTNLWLAAQFLPGVSHSVEKSDGGVLLAVEGVGWKGGGERVGR
ncbi:MAG: RNA 3'-terminal phosphate cyclase [Promethearchaeota archaeon]